MSPGKLMTLGAICGVISAVSALFGGHQIATIVLVAFGSGAVFGKGYGVWEERSRRATKGGRE